MYEVEEQAGEALAWAQLREELARAGVQIALAEAGTGGAIARLLQDGATGAPVLTAARAYTAPDDLALAVHVSPAKLNAFGAVSAMVAAEAAAALIDTYEGGWGLVVLSDGGNREQPTGVSGGGDTSAPCFVALGTPSVTVIVECERSRIVWKIYDLLREPALRRLAERG